MGEDAVPSVPPTAPTVVAVGPMPSTVPPPPPSTVVSTPVLPPSEHGKRTGENGLNEELPIATPSREVMNQYWSKFKRTKPNAALASPAPTSSVESPANEAPPPVVVPAPASTPDPLTSVTVADPAHVTPPSTEPIPAEPGHADPPVPSSPMVSLASSLLPEPETPVPTPHVAMAAALTRATTVDMMPSTPSPAPTAPALASQAAPLAASLTPAEAKAREVLSSDHTYTCMYVYIYIYIMYMHQGVTRLTRVA